MYGDAIRLTARFYIEWRHDDENVFSLHTYLHTQRKKKSRAHLTRTMTPMSCHVRE